MLYDSNVDIQNLVSVSSIVEALINVCCVSVMNYTQVARAVDNAQARYPALSAFPTARIQALHSHKA